ncbi:MAG TPA: nucleotide exchange factor GrpE [Trebonia sp.]|jgi:molecular chaperone GrpE
MSFADDNNSGPVIRDRRRIDPVTGQVRDPDSAAEAPSSAAGAGPQPGSGRGKHSSARPDGQPGSPADAGGSGGAGQDTSNDEVATLTKQLTERTFDLQRLQAEYANYRKRVERDRQAVREQALASVLTELLPALDDIGRAREHGELSGGFKSVADSLESTLSKLGLETYAEKGDPFDPTVHEALMHSYSTEVSEPTCVQILQPGYKIGDRILRPARVAVAEPGGESADETEESPHQAPADGGS